MKPRLRGRRGWQRVARPAHADGARARTEVLWLNPAAAARAELPLGDRTIGGAA